MPTVTFTTGQVLTAAQMNQVGQDSDWQTVGSFSNSWGAGSVAPAYRKVGSRVFLRGRLSAGTANTTAFTLPAGYQPSTTQSLISCNSSTTTPNQVSISTGGAVTPQVSAVTSLDGLWFFVD